MNNQVKTTIAFTGHRSNRIPTDEQALSEYLDKTVTDLYFKGYRRFLTGMSEGFDLMAGEAVLRLKAIHTDIRLITVIPFTGQAHRFSPEDKQRYGHLFNYCDDSVLISEHYFTGCFHRRNDYLTDNSALVIAYYDRQEQGGTHYTVTRAISKGIPVINLFDSNDIQISN